MTTQTDKTTNVLVTKLFKECDKAATALHAKTKDLAECLFAQMDVKAIANGESDYRSEETRVVNWAKDTIKAAKYVPKHERNIWLNVRQHLLVMMEPDLDIEIEKKGKTSKEAITYKKASECATARDMSAAAKQVREHLGLTDGRGANAPKPKSDATKVTEQVAEWCKTATGRKYLKAALRASGFEMVEITAGTKAQPKVPAKAPREETPKPRDFDENLAKLRADNEKARKADSAAYTHSMQH